MQEDALAFFRGTCHLFCSDWLRSGVVDHAPLVWVCGDLHVENFGRYKGDNRLVYFDIADLDGGLLATCTWDLTRLATSILISPALRAVSIDSGDFVLRELMPSQDKLDLTACEVRTRSWNFLPTTRASSWRGASCEAVVRWGWRPDSSPKSLRNGRGGLG